MKKITAILLLIYVFCVCFAQTPQEVISQDPQKAAGAFYVYDGSSLPELMPAPEGYQPFYISHFARHGARYCTSEYDTLNGWLTKAWEEGLLTNEGKDFYTRYQAFYKTVRYCSGNLTGVGKAQHRDMAGRMFRRFPQVFDGPTHVEAVSTESPRVIMSMWSCLSGLQALDKDMDINADASGKYAPWLQPSLSSNPYMIKDGFKRNDASENALKAYFEETVPWKEIAGRFFTAPDALATLKATPEKFVSTLYSVVTDTYCLDRDKGCFDDVFTADQLYSVWKGMSARYFLHVANYENSGSQILDYAGFTIGQIIESAEADIASGATQLRLRFGHDSGIAPLLVMLDVNGCGKATSSFEESLEIFPSYIIPMGASLQLVFYRNAQGNILLKALVNEQEATLPLQPVQGPYYSWEDFKAHFKPVAQTAKRNVTTAEPLAALKAVDWNWRPVENSKVEVGGASVKVFGSVQDISVARFPVKYHAVSVVERDGDAAAITSRLGEDNKALAAINGSYFNTKTLMPVTYVKDEGKVLCSITSDKGSTRSNGMFRIQDKKGRKVDILRVDSLGTANAAKGWREAIVSGPVLLEDGAPVIYEDDGSRDFRKFYARRHPRTILGYTLDGWVYFIVVDGRFPGKATLPSS